MRGSPFYPDAVLLIMYENKRETLRAVSEMKSAPVFEKPFSETKYSSDPGM